MRNGIIYTFVVLKLRNFIILAIHPSHVNSTIARLFTHCMFSSLLLNPSDSLVKSAPKSQPLRGATLCFQTGSAAAAAAACRRLPPPPNFRWLSFENRSEFSRNILQDVPPGLGNCVDYHFVIVGQILTCPRAKNGFFGGGGVDFVNNAQQKLPVRITPNQVRCIRLNT